MKKISIVLIGAGFLLLSVFIGAGKTVPIELFPLDKYNQDINHWISPDDSDYDKLLISSHDQKEFLDEFYSHYYATGDNAKSPWSREHVESELQQKIVTERLSQQAIVDEYDNTHKTHSKDIGYGANFKPYSGKWFENIMVNMNLKQFIFPLQYNSENRGIAVKNLSARALPTNDPHFYSFLLAGEGYPFDNLQDAAVWVGTPVYIVGETLDHQWFLVLTPHHYVAWVDSTGIAKVNDNFINTWKKHAKREMVAVTRTNVSVVDNDEKYRFNCYVGAVFPGTNKSAKNDKTIEVLIPVADMQQNAQIKLAKLSKENAAVMPLPATPHNFANIMSTLIGRPYGWGNIYFYNDCSAELQSLYTPFGIWLPRNSASQAEAGKVILDMSDEKDPQKRLDYLMKHGKKFTTIVYINGHVMLYIGNYKNPNSSTHEEIAMTYQTKWGLNPADNSYRAVLGQSVLFPLLEIYPENPKLDLFANKPLFRLVQLGNSEPTESNSTSFVEEVSLYPDNFNGVTSSN